MKDQFRKELKKYPVITTGSEGGSEYKSSWQYFDSMMFIRDEIQPSKMTGNLDASEGISSETEENEGNDQQVENVAETEQLSDERESENPSPASVSTSTSGNSSVRKKRTANLQREDMLGLEKKKLELMEARLNMSQANEALTKDEDYMYLMSILPTMKKLSVVQKLRLRGKINEWLIEEITRNEYAVTGYFTAPTEPQPDQLQQCSGNGNYYMNL